MSARFEDLRVGAELPSLSRIVTREDVRAYASAGGDPNPLHQNDDVARSAGFPGIIAHGMFTMAQLAAFVASWAGDPANILRLSVQFRAHVLMGEEIVSGGRVKAIEGDSRTAIVELWVTVDRDGSTEFPIRKGEAEVHFPA